MITTKSSLDLENNLNHPADAANRMEWFSGYVYTLHTFICTGLQIIAKCLHDSYSRLELDWTLIIVMFLYI